MDRCTSENPTSEVKLPSASSSARGTDAYPSKSCLEIAQNNGSDESPRSVAMLPLVSLSHRGVWHDEVPAMSEQNSKREKKVFDFVRAESNGNLKGIMRRSTRKKVEENHLWWEDSTNEDKHITLRTDESVSTFDDGSTDWGQIDKSGCRGSCNGGITELLAGNIKRVSWIDENSPYDAPDHELMHPDETMDSDDDDDGVFLYPHHPCDSRKLKIVGDLVGYYREKLENSFSEAAGTSQQWHVERSMSQDTMSVSLDDDSKAAVVQVDMFSSLNVPSSSKRDEEDGSITGDCSVSTHQVQACNTSCFG